MLPKRERGLQKLDYNQREIEQLLMIASYHEEITRRKLASQMALTLGETCGREKIVRILSGDYHGATVCREQLRHRNVDCNEFYVMEQNGTISVVVPDSSDKKAEVYADYGSSDGILAIGKEAYQTMDGTVYELDLADAEEFHVIVYDYPVEYETEPIVEKNI